MGKCLMTSFARLGRLALLVIALEAGPVAGAQAQEAGASGASNATNEANNPLTPKITVNLQDYYTPSFYGPLIPTRTACSCVV